MTDPTAWPKAIAQGETGAQGPGLSPGQCRDLCALAVGEGAASLDARDLLYEWLARDARAWETLKDELARAPEEVLEAAGQWLFFPEGPHEVAVLRGLLSHAADLLRLGRARPGAWAVDGLANLLPAAPPACQRELAALAAREGWAAQVLAAWPPDLPRPGGTGRPVPPFSTGAEAGRARQWPGFPSGIKALEYMARVTAREGGLALQAARRAARELGRTVLLLGNCSLGGPPLWAAPGPWELPRGEALLARARGLSVPDREARQLAGLRARRLAGGALARALADLELSLALAGEGREALAEARQKAEVFLAPGAGQSLCARPLAPGLARRRFAAALSRAEGLRQSGLQGVEWAWRLCQAAGGAPLVLPWADKFAASTYKEGDFSYLAGLARLFARLSPPPLLVLLDSTPHPGSAGLRLILPRADKASGGLGLVGLGEFAGGPQPDDLARALARAGRGNMLVAIEPLPADRPARPLAELAAGAPCLAWPASRDGAPWLLSGTSLSALCDPLEPEGRDQPTPWLETSLGLAPLGAWFRLRVRGLAGRYEPPWGPACLPWLALGRALNLL